MSDALYDRKGDVSAGRTAGRAYTLARDGVAGLAIREYGRTIIDFLAAYIRPKHAAIAACLLLFLWYGAVHGHGALHRQILEAKSCSLGRTPDLRWKMPVPSYKASACPANGYTSWAAKTGRQKFVYVAYPDYVRNQMWRAVRALTGWLGLLAIWFAQALWRRGDHMETTAALFGADSEEFHKAAEIPLPISTRTDADDWLVNPSAILTGDQRAQRPVFGRKAL